MQAPPHVARWKESTKRLGGKSLTWPAIVAVDSLGTALAGRLVTSGFESQLAPPTNDVSDE